MLPLVTGPSQKLPDHEKKSQMQHDFVDFAHMKIYFTAVSCKEKRNIRR